MQAGTQNSAEKSKSQKTCEERADTNLWMTYFSKISNFLQA
jgi:hypothetical protein